MKSSAATNKFFTYLFRRSFSVGGVPERAALSSGAMRQAPFDKLRAGSERRDKNNKLVSLPKKRCNLIGYKDLKCQQNSLRFIIEGTGK